MRHPGKQVLICAVVAGLLSASCGEQPFGAGTAASTTATVASGTSPSTTNAATSPLSTSTSVVASITTSTAVFTTTGSTLGPPPTTGSTLGPPPTTGSTLGPPPISTTTTSWVIWALQDLPWFRLLPDSTINEIATACPTAAQVAAVDADLAITFDSDPTAPALVCHANQGSADLTLLQKHAYNAVLVMEAAAFDVPLPWTNLGLYDWFVAAIDGIRFRGDIAYSQCCEPANVINLRSQLGSEETDAWMDPLTPALGLAHTMLLMVHEARHNNGYPHTCGSDDNTIDELGAWGVQYYLHLWLADHAPDAFMAAPITGYAAFYQDNHRAYAQGLKNAAFCNEP